MLLLRLLLPLLLLLLAGCGTTTTTPPPVVTGPPPAPPVALAPTVAGEEIAPTPPLPEVEGDPVAGVSWGTPRNGGGAILWYGDRSVCVRHQRRLGVELKPERYGAPDLGPSFVKLDVLEAEKNALERGLDLVDVEPWVVATTLPGEAAATGTARAEQVAQVFGSRFARPISVALVAGERPALELLLVRRGDRRAITDRLAVVVEGPPLQETGVLEQLLLGPEPADDNDFDALVVRAWNGELHSAWTAPSTLNTDRDRASVHTLARAINALGNGCELPVD